MHRRHAKSAAVDPSPRHPLERRILSTIRRHRLIEKGQRGIVSVSGGPDSMALLRILHALRGDLGLRGLDVLHFDHGLRPESAREADWVVREAGKLELAVHIVRAEHLAGLRSGVQAAARAWRLEASRRLMAEWEAAWVATGHQREDRLETWLLKWLRGAHLTHLRGMEWRREKQIRPLLDTPRADLIAYLEQREQTWLEDPTNLLPKYKRNRVRHELLPLLEALTGGVADGDVGEAAAAGAPFARRIAALEQQSRQLQALVEQLAAEHAFEQNDPSGADGSEGHWIAAEGLIALPDLVVGAVLHRFVTSRLPGAVPHGQIEQVLSLLRREAPQWSLHLPEGRTLRRAGARIFLERQAAAGEMESAIREVESGGTRFRLPTGWTVRAARLASGQAPPGGHDGPVASAVAVHNIPEGALLELRTRRPGERFQPPWKAHPVKLKDFLRDRGIPLWQRDRVPLLCWEDRVIALLPLPAPPVTGLAAWGHHEAGAGKPVAALWVAVEN